jgi:hypothetical protein
MRLITMWHAVDASRFKLSIYSIAVGWPAEIADIFYYLSASSSRYEIIQALELAESLLKRESHEMVYVICLSKDRW